MSLLIDAPDPIARARLVRLRALYKEALRREHVSISCRA